MPHQDTVLMTQPPLLHRNACANSQPVRNSYKPRRLNYTTPCIELYVRVTSAT